MEINSQNGTKTAEPCEQNHMLLNGNCYGDDNFQRFPTSQTEEEETCLQQNDTSHINLDVEETLDVHVEVTFTKIQVWRNLCILSISFLLLFAAYDSAQNLQSTLNKQDGIGSITLALIYSCQDISALLLSVLLIYYIGIRLLIPACMVCYILYISANLYPVWGTMIPSSIILGLSSAPLWISQLTYSARLAELYAKLYDTPFENALNTLLGIFHMFFGISKVLGNLIASVFFSPKHINATSLSDTDIQDCILNKHGPDISITTLERPPQNEVYLVCGIWIGMGILGVFVAALLNNIPTEKDTSISKKEMILKQLKAAVNHARTSRIQLLLIPMSSYSGISNGFLTADFTKSFVGCVLGIENVGYVMVCHGGVNALATVIFGRLVKHVGHLLFFTFCFLTFGSINVTLLVWMPTAEESWALYLIAALWGVADAIIKVQLLAFYGSIFKTRIEAAYCVYCVLESLGAVLSFSYSVHLSTAVKLYILLVWLGLSAVTYYIVEYLNRHKKQDIEIESEIKTLS